VTPHTAIEQRVYEVLNGFVVPYRLSSLIQTMRILRLFASVIGVGTSNAPFRWEEEYAWTGGLS
jgi:hypothetical protein